MVKTARMLVTQDYTPNGAGEIALKVRTGDGFGPGWNGAWGGIDANGRSFATAAADSEVMPVVAMDCRWGRS